MERMEFDWAGGSDGRILGHLTRIWAWLLALKGQLMQGWLAHLEARNLARMSRGLDAMSDHMRRDIGLPTREFCSRWQTFDWFS